MDRTNGVREGSICPWIGPIRTCLNGTRRLSGGGVPVGLQIRLQPGVALPPSRLRAGRMEGAALLQGTPFGSQSQGGREHIPDAGANQ
eukprot:1195688-Prorocentrum_minimum.AAC.3